MRIMGLLIAVTLSLVAGFVAWMVAGGNEPKVVPAVVASATQPDFKTVNVLIATKPIAIGEKLDASMLDTQPWPSHLLVDGFVVDADSSKKVVGMVTRSAFMAREPIMLSKLANPGDPSFLAAALAKGKKVMSISTDGVASVSGFVFPGDRVDVMVTHKVPKAGEVKKNVAPEIETVVETLLSNVKVLAVDQRSTGGAVAKDKKGLPSSISLEVSLEEAQRLRLAQETGYVSLVLRSLVDKDVVDDSLITHVEDISGNDDAEEEAKSSVMIVRGVNAVESESALGSVAKTVESSGVAIPVVGEPVVDMGGENVQ